MNDKLKFDESQKKRCWGCAFFSTSPNWSPVGSGSSEYSCYLYGGSNIRRVGSGSCFCDCWEKKLIDTEGYDVESDKSYYEARDVEEAIRELKKKFQMMIADKDAEIAELKEKLKTINELVKTSGEFLKDAKANTEKAKAVEAKPRIWGVYRREADGSEELIGRHRSMVAAHDHAERMEEDWDDPSGATFSFREIKEATK